MSTVIKSSKYELVVKGATIRAQSGITDDGPVLHHKKYITGIVSILPKVQIVLGDQMDSFKRALNLSRLPLALRKIISQGCYETWEVLHLPAGNIPEASIATISVYNNIMVGLTYNRDVLKNNQFRKMVRLSAMHRLCICSKDDKSRALKATQCVEKLTGVPRDKLIVSEKKRSIRVRVDYKSKLSLPLYYIFVLDDTDKYNLLQVSFDLNDVGQRFSEHAGEKK